MKIKYPRTFHLPYSLTITKDDKKLLSDGLFHDMQEIVLTEKMDGENTTVYPHGVTHARSLDGRTNPWQSWLKKSVTQWSQNIPENWRVCGENLYARHSIEYQFAVQSQYFQVFSIWNQDVCLSWRETEEWCQLLNIEHVPVIHIGKYNGQDSTLEIFKDYQKKRNLQGFEVEGFVIRNANQFKIEDFSSHVAKYVRSNHVKTDEHWTKHWTVNSCKKPF